jgi:hypothetical protein
MGWAIGGRGGIISKGPVRKDWMGGTVSCGTVFGREDGGGGITGFNRVFALVTTGAGGGGTVAKIRVRRSPRLRGEIRPDMFPLMMVLRMTW